VYRVADHECEGTPPTTLSDDVGVADDGTGSDPHEEVIQFGVPLSGLDRGGITQIAAGGTTDRLVVCR
jgi:hypothetical protein